MTQTNSRPRIKHDTIGNDGLENLFKLYAVQGKEEFRLTCKSVIEESTGKRSTKDTFLTELDRASSKDKMLAKTTNYLLAGQGLGV